MCFLSLSSRFVLTLFVLLLCEMLWNYWNNEAHKKNCDSFVLIFFTELKIYIKGDTAGSGLEISQ